MRPKWGTTKKAFSSMLGMLILFSIITSLVPVGYATGGYPEHVLFTRTRYYQNWDCTEIAAANGATADDMGVTLQVFLKDYFYSPMNEDPVELRVVAFAVDRNDELISFSSYIIKELKITMKKMSIENDNGFDPNNVYTYVGNYFINDECASIDTQLWRNQNLTWQLDNEADWVQDLILAGAFGAIGHVINGLPLGIPLAIAIDIAEMGLKAMPEKEAKYADPESTPGEYEPAYYKGKNNDPSRGLGGFSDASLGGHISWRLWDSCTMNHRLEIIAELTYARYHPMYNYWFDQHTVETSLTVSSVLGDGYGESYDYKWRLGNLDPGAPINEGYDAPDSWGGGGSNPRIRAGKLFYGVESPEGEVDPAAINEEYLYSGYLTEGSDENDWYKVYISTHYYQDNSAYIRLDVLGGADFDLRVYHATTNTNYYSTKRGSVTDEVIVEIYQAGYYYIEAYVYKGSGEYILTAYDVHQNFLGYGNGGGGGCPFVYTWNGTQHAIDNNILGDSEASGGADVEDYYRLEQPLAVKNGRYSLLIGEFEQEHSYLDQAKLLAVDHESDVNVAVSPSGEILTYKEPTPPISAIDNYGNDQLDLLEAIDGDYYESQPDDYIIFDFGNLNIGEGAKLVMWADAEFKIVKMCVHVQVWNATGSWEDVAVVRTRVYWATEIVDLLDCLPDANGELKVRLFFTGVHKIDYVGLDTTKQDDFTVHYGNLVSAIHSETGSVKTELLESDSIYAEIVPDQQIELEFTLPENSKNPRTYIIYVKGRYYKIA